MRRIPWFHLPLLALLVLVTAAAPALAVGAQAPISVGGDGPQPSAEPSALDRQVTVTDGQAYVDFLLASGLSEEDVREYMRARRAHAIRVAFERGDERSIAEIREDVPAAEIEAALAAEPGSDITAKYFIRAYYIGCNYGQGAAAQFHIYGTWSAQWETSTGAKTSEQTGHCSDFWNGCTIGDSISGNASIAWKYHHASAFQEGWHNAWCN